MRFLSIAMAGVLAWSWAGASPRSVAAPEPSAPSRELDVQLDQFADQLSKGLTFQQAGKIAVADFPGLDGKVSDVGRFLSEELTTRLVRSGRCQVIERHLLDKMLEEQKLGASGLIDEATAIRLGKLLGADAILAGTVADLTTSLKVNGRVIDTATGAVLAVATARIPMDKETAALLDRRPDPAAPAGTFDGVWEVFIDCASVGPAQAYQVRLPAQVQDGVLHGLYGTEGIPPFFTLDGKILANGSAVLTVSGLAGDPKYNLNRAMKGSRIYYHIAASFAGAKGSGRRMEMRSCEVSFLRR
jgi:TolB-like protein